MAQIIRGTTPTIEFKFSSVNVANITVADLTIKQGETTVITKDLTSATTGTSSLSWQLTQADTLTLASVTPVTIVCDWKLNSGLRGRSEILKADIGEPGINDEI